MKKYFFIISILLLNYNIKAQSWEQVLKRIPVLNVNKDSVIICENINYQYPNKAIVMTDEEALKLIFHDNKKLLKTEILQWDMMTEKVSRRDTIDNKVLACFQLQDSNFTIVATLYGYDYYTLYAVLYLLNKNKEFSDSLVIMNQFVETFDSDIKGIFYIKNKTIYLSYDKSYSSESNTKLYATYIIDNIRLKFIKTNEMRK